MVRRVTPSTGWSTSSLPSASSRGDAPEDTGENYLLEDDQRVALADRLALLAEDLDDRPRVLGLDGHLHLHRLEYRDGVALFDLVADGALDFPYGAGDVGLDLSHACLPNADRQ